MTTVPDTNAIAYAAHRARIEVAHNNGEHGIHNPAEWAACHICLPDEALAARVAG